MSAGRGVTEQQATFTRQVAILRKNLTEWDTVLNHPHRTEDWPTMVGRLNAAFHQTTTMDRNIDDVLEHFVYVPKKCTANAQDIPFFLSTRIETSPDDSPSPVAEDPTGDPVEQLARFEKNGTRIAAEYEENMVRF